MLKPKLFLFLFALFLAGCTVSLHPLFTSEDSIHEPGLVGVWQTADKSRTFSIIWIPQSKAYYLRTEIQDQILVPGEFNAQIGSLGKHRFLQMVPRRPMNISARSFYGGHFLQAWSFWKMVLDGDKLTLSPMNYQSIEAMAKANKLGLKYEKQDGGFITLTASTEDLKAFVLKYAEDKGLFTEDVVFERKPENTKTPETKAATNAVPRIP